MPKKVLECLHKAPIPEWDLKDLSHKEIDDLLNVKGKMDSRRFLQITKKLQNAIREFSQCSPTILRPGTFPQMDVGYGSWEL